MAKTGLYQPFAIKPPPPPPTPYYDVTASRVISRVKILQPGLDCYRGDEHNNIQMEKIKKDRQHNAVLI